MVETKNNQQDEQKKIKPGIPSGSKQRNAGSYFQTRIVSMSLLEAANPAVVVSPTVHAESTSLSLTDLDKKIPRAKVSKKINRNRKGRDNENKCADVFLAKGFAVHQCPRVKFQNVDVFNLFDVLAKKKGLPTFWVQVKTNACPSGKVKKDILEFAQKFGSRRDRFEIWCWFDRKGFRRWTLHTHGWIESKDFELI